MTSKPSIRIVMTMTIKLLFSFVIVLTTSRTAVTMAFHTSILPTAKMMRLGADGSFSLTTTTRIRQPLPWRHPSSTPPHQTLLFASRIDAPTSHHHHRSSFKGENTELNEKFQALLYEYGYGNRLVTISTENNNDLPILAEVYDRGQWELCLIVGFRFPQQQQQEEQPQQSPPPRVEIQTLTNNNDNDSPTTASSSSTARVVDFGQITTIWNDVPLTSEIASSMLNYHECIEETMKFFVVQQEDQSMQQLYHDAHEPSTNNKKSKKYKTLSKKQISKLLSQLVRTEEEESLSSFATIQQQLTTTVYDALLRKLIKTGPSMLRLVDSTMAMEYLFQQARTTNNDKDNKLFQNQVVGAHVLSQDANLGGRFKRWPCTYVGSSSNGDITIMNGGWLAVDPSVRTDTEARKFAQRADTDDSRTTGSTSTTITTTTTSKTTKTTNNSSGGNNRVVMDQKQQLLVTAADERIAQRLECFAMGEMFSKAQQQQQDDSLLEQDVRQALKALGLPLSPQGAQEALLRIGRWTQKQQQQQQGSTSKLQFEPWNQSALEAARYYAKWMKECRSNLYQQSAMVKGGGAAKSTNTRTTKTKAATSLENRIDLTNLPCICVDAKRTSFRDDAIGVRPRASTGRKVIPEASKWEILIHITDVSDLYSPKLPYKNNDDQQQQNDTLILKQSLATLQNSATQRGMSRYDLPLGPLHLIPPIALEALAFETTKIDMTPYSSPSSSRQSPPPQTSKSVNRCVTLWAYIDERNGKVLDAGLERTLISTPIALSFNDASNILDGGDSDSRGVFRSEIFKDRTHVLSKIRAVLSVVERNLALWSNHNQKTNQAARKREERLSARELVAKQQQHRSGGTGRGGNNNKPQLSDDGRDGFQRTRGHKLVDNALDLYGFGVSSLLRRANAPIPRASGSGALRRGGRVASAPLRRYIDGMAQRQALSVLCGYGGPPLTKNECSKANQLADKANNAITNLRSLKSTATTAMKATTASSQQQEALRLLQAELVNKKNRPIPAISTGRQNEVSIMGIGATAKCRGVKGTLKPGKKLMVQVRQLDAEKGTLSVSLVRES